MAQLRAAHGAIALVPKPPASIRSRPTYLLQISTGDDDPVLVFDLFDWDPEALAPLWQFLMADQGPELVFHNAVFDVGHLWALGVEPPADRSLRCCRSAALSAG